MWLTNDVRFPTMAEAPPWRENRARGFFVLAWQIRGRRTTFLNLLRVIGRRPGGRTCRVVSGVGQRVSGGRLPGDDWRNGLVAFHRRA